MHLATGLQWIDIYVDLLTLLILIYEILCPTNYILINETLAFYSFILVLLDPLYMLLTLKKKNNVCLHPNNMLDVMSFHESSVGLIFTCNEKDDRNVFSIPLLYQTFELKNLKSSLTRKLFYIINTLLISSLKYR